MTVITAENLHKYAFSHETIENVRTSILKKIEKNQQCFKKLEHLNKYTIIFSPDCGKCSYW